ncbi:hypothetical protein C8Q76DRAFT_415707 [Earliella scabrosa]|nr:hypothetical protein C8Q76DRAFT_415707 [Earliella scabrosa]
MVALTNDIAALIGFGCEAVCWGIYLVLFLISVVLLVRRLRTHNTHVAILIAIVALFLCCTAHFALEFNHFYTTLAATGVDRFANETNSLLGADILISVCDLLGDFILLYRCWIVWERNYWVIVLPTLTAVSGFASIIAFAHILLVVDPTSPVPPSALVPLGLAGYSLPLATNVMATALIVVKLWWVLRSAAKIAGGDTPLFGSGYNAVRNALAIVIESGALYLVTQLVFVIVYSLKHPSQAILAVIAVQIYGIAPTLIIMRVALGVSSESTVQQSPTELSGPRWHSRTGSSSAISRSNNPRTPLPSTLDDTLKSDGGSMEMMRYMSTSRVILGDETV